MIKTTDFDFLKFFFWKCHMSTHPKRRTSTVWLPLRASTLTSTTWCQFHLHFTSSFSVWVCNFLEKANRQKAANKMFVKLTKGHWYRHPELQWNTLCRCHPLLQKQQGFNSNYKTINVQSSIKLFRFINKKLLNFCKAGYLFDIIHVKIFASIYI